MKAVILAAGRGRRLRPLTDTIPKPMATVNNKPILEYTLSILPKEVDSVIIVIGWLGYKIKNYFGQEYKNKKILYAQQQEPLGPYHALSVARGLLDQESFLVVSGDDLYSKEDIAAVFLSPNLSILVKETNEPEQFGICITDQSGRYLKELIEKPKNYCGNMANIGVYKLDWSIFSEPLVYGQNGEHYLAPMIGNLAKKQKIDIVRASFWHPIADLNDLANAQKVFLK